MLGRALNAVRYRYGVAIAAVLAVAALRLAFFQELGAKDSFATFYLAVICAALYGGMRAGLLATALSAIVADYFWVEPNGRFGITGPSDWLALAVFLAGCTMISWFAESMQHAHARIALAETEAKAAAERAETEKALRESRARLAAAFASMTEAIFIADAEGLLIDFNEAFVRYHRFRDREECSRTIADCPRYLDAYFQDGTPAPPERWAMARALQGETASNVEYMLRRKDTGETWWGSYNFAPIMEEDGRIIGAIVAGREITERKQAEEALAAAHRQTQSIIDNTTNLVYAFDLEERFLMANAAVARLLNSTPEQMIGKRRHEFMPKEDADWHEANDRQAIEAGRALEFEECSQLEGRSITWFTTKFPLHDANGRIYAVAGISADVSERKRSEEALRESEQRERERAEELAVLFEAVPIPTFIARDPDCLHLSGNRLADEILRIPHGDELSMTAPGENRPQHFRVFKDGRELQLDALPAQRSARGEHVSDFEFSLVFDDGMVRHVLGYGTPLLDDRGHPRGTVASLVDITERKRAEQMLQELKSAAERYAAEMETLMDAVPAAVFVAHDIECRQMSGNRMTQELLGLPPTANFSKSAPTAERPANFKAMKDGREIPADQLPVQMAARGQEVRDFEFDLAFDDGRFYTFLGDAVPLLNESGQPSGAIGAFKDISERKRAEAALRESEERFRSMANAMPQLAWIANADGYIFWYNQRWYEYTGTTPEQMKGWGWQSVHDPELLPSVLERWKAAIATGEPFYMEFPLRGAACRSRMRRGASCNGSEPTQTSRRSSGRKRFRRPIFPRLPECMISAGGFLQRKGLSRCCRRSWIRRLPLWGRKKARCNCSKVIPCG